MVVDLGLGGIGCFSFYPTKNLGGFGDGGMITTNDEKLADKIRMLRAHGGRDEYHNTYVGGNFRLDAIQAAVLRVKLKYLDKWHEARRRNAAIYDKLFAGSAVIRPKIADGNTSIFNQYCIQIPDRDRVMTHLRANEIGHRIYYPVPLHLQECFADLRYARGDFPHAENLADHALAVPMYPELRPDQLKQVAETVLQAV